MCNKYWDSVCLLFKKKPDSTAINLIYDELSDTCFLIIVYNWWNIEEFSALIFILLLKNGLLLLLLLLLLISFVTPVVVGLVTLELLLVVHSVSQWSLIKARKCSRSAWRLLYSISDSDFKIGFNKPSVTKW